MNRVPLLLHGARDKDKHWLWRSICTGASWCTGPYILELMRPWQICIIRNMKKVKRPSVAGKKRTHQWFMAIMNNFLPRRLQMPCVTVNPFSWSDSERHPFSRVPKKRYAKCTWDDASIYIYCMPWLSLQLNDNGYYDLLQRSLPGGSPVMSRTVQEGSHVRLVSPSNIDNQHSCRTKSTVFVASHSWASAAQRLRILTKYKMCRAMKMTPKSETNALLWRENINHRCSRVCRFVAVAQKNSRAGRRPLSFVSQRSQTA